MSRSRFRTRYLPLHEAAPGMILAEPVQSVKNRLLVYSVAAGLVLTEESIAQFEVHGIQFIAVQEEDFRKDEEVAVEVALAARRAIQIFADADLTDPVMASFFDQILLYRTL
ncbi:MAG: hypothetical protein PHU46_04435 [Rhodocyclaceae bacterium]|nr:hypothetical protein [Rhodocyclaceae bacterium]